METSFGCVIVIVIVKVKKVHDLNLVSIHSRRHTFEVHGMIARRGACQWKRRCVIEVSVSVLCLSSCSVCLAGTCFFDSSITSPFVCEVHFVTAPLVEQRICNISKPNK